MSCARYRSSAISRHLRAVRADTRGATMLEFGLVAAPLVALLVGILQTSLVFFSEAGLQTTAESAARVIMTGQAQQQNLSAAQFKTAVCAQLPPFLDCSKLMIDVQQATNFSSVNTGTPTITYDASGNPTNTWSYTPGAGGTIMILRLMYIWPIGTGPMGMNLANSGPSNRLLIATSVFKTEPF